MTAKGTLLDDLCEGLDEEYNTEREGIHVSDLVLCPRKSCFQKLEPLPKTPVELGFFTSGKAIHGALQSLAKKFPYYEIEKEVWLDDIVAHIDLFNNKDGIPIEAKSARISEITEDQLHGRDKVNPKKNKVHYLRQLEAYMAMTDSDKGKVFVQLLMHFGDKPFVEFDHTMTKVQRDKVLEKLREDAKGLRTGIARKDPSIPRNVAYDNDLNWLCNYCPYAEKCTALNVNKRAEDWNKK